MVKGEGQRPSALVRAMVVFQPRRLDSPGLGLRSRSQERPGPPAGHRPGYFEGTSRRISRELATSLKRPTRKQVRFIEGYTEKIALAPAMEAAAAEICCIALLK